jgi:aminoglycoside phosphotransferase (APT) family kinase protein
MAETIPADVLAVDDLPGNACAYRAAVADLPPMGVLTEIERLAGPVGAVTRLAGGQHSDTWRVDTADPPHSVVVRLFPAGDHDAAAHEQAVLRALDGIGGLAPRALGFDLGGRWSERPASLISRLDGEVDITPDDPERWARELGRGLAVVHAVPRDRLVGFSSVFDPRQGSFERLDGPLAASVRSRWQSIAAAPQVLTHNDYWSGNVVWRDDRLAGIVDWSGAAVGPRGYDLGWCRLDLVLLFGEYIADVFTAVYEAASGESAGDVALWDWWAAARSHHFVHEWAPNYVPLGRPDLDAAGLRRRHAWWTEQLLARATRS